MVFLLKAENARQIKPPKVTMTANPSREAKDLEIFTLIWYIGRCS
jgi:hypothetical protein